MKRVIIFPAMISGALFLLLLPVAADPLVLAGKLAGFAGLVVLIRLKADSWLEWFDSWVADLFVD